MIINKSGIAIRMEVSSLRVMGRATQGVKLINLKDSDSIAAVAKVVHDDDDISDVDEIDVVEENNDNEIPEEELEWTHKVLNDFEMTIDALGIETVMFLLSKYHEDIVRAWVKEGVDIQHGTKQ